MRNIHNFFFFRAFIPLFFNMQLFFNTRLPVVSYPAQNAVRIYLLSLAIHGFSLANLASREGLFEKG